ncbi:MAG: AEC family transporter [Firmicutes bacterium]|nr:AEC family transporter [Bacillota bacterium]
MENVWFSFNSIAPIFILMGLGWLLHRIGFLRDSFVDAATKVVFNICIPCMLFRDICSNDFDQTFDVNLLLAAAGGTVFVYVLLYLLTPLWIKDRPTRAAFVQASFRSNFVVIGVPIVGNVAGSLGVAKVALALCVIAPLYNILAVLVLATAQPDAKGRVLWRKIITNPMIIGSLLGILASLIDLRLPLFLYEPVDALASMSMPLALLALGGAFSPSKSAEDIPLAAAAAVFKTVFNPLLMLPLFFWMDLSRLDIVVLMILFACPTAIASFPMAYQMQANHRLASMAIVFSNALSLFTLFAFIYTLRLLGWV